MYIAVNKVSSSCNRSNHRRYHSSCNRVKGSRDGRMTKKFWKEMNGKKGS